MSRHLNLRLLAKPLLSILCLTCGPTFLCHGASDDTNLPPTSILVKEQTKAAQLGDTFCVGVYGEFAQEITNGLARDAVTTRKGLTLYLNGVQMTGLTSVILPAEAFGTPPSHYAKPTLVLQYALERDANDETNRKAWDTLLRRIGMGQQFVEVGVGLNNEIPHLASHIDPKTDPLQFWVRPLWVIWTVIITGFAVFIALMCWVKSTAMLREAGPGTAYSLGKSQMAFWGLLVALSFFGVWMVSWKMERIPPQVLVLLGISATTGLSSILIGSSKRSSASNEHEKLKQDRVPLQKQQDDLTAEQASLQSQRAAGGEKWDQTKEARLKVVVESLASLALKLADIDQAIADQTVISKPPASEGCWWTDIISDENGMSFHRFQVVLWTIILGIVFLWTVANTFSMPEFEPTLLILMGISNGTYLGFKTKES